MASEFCGAVNCCEAATSAGNIRGQIRDGIHTFLGVPYGAPTSGCRRFRPPVLPTPWVGVRDGGKRPVMVWFHGGGFALLSGSSPAYDGERLSRRGDVVVVTLNHRINVFGYLYLAQFGGEDYADSGNVGQLDLIAALQWVRDNISGFGGDPGNVTIFGESGGGGKVTAVMAMPAARGLFHKAIVQSGPYLRAMLPEHASSFAVAMMARLGLQPQEVDELQQVPVPRLIEALDVVTQGAAIRAFTLDWERLPVFLEKWLSGLDNARRVVELYRRLHPDLSASDLYFEITADRGIGGNSILVAERKARQAAAPVFMYQVAQRMSEAWIAFARSGNPSTRDLHWPAFDLNTRSTMIFNVHSTVVADPRSAERQLLAALPEIKHLG